MSLAQQVSGAREAAEEILPLPPLPKFFGGKSLVRRIAGQRLNAERVIAKHCIDRCLGVQALNALDGEARRLALSGRSVPVDIADAIAALEHALGRR
jgi:hypothetical protein